MMRLYSKLNIALDKLEFFMDNNWNVRSTALCSHVPCKANTLANDVAQLQALLPACTQTRSE